MSCDYTQSNFNYQSDVYSFSNNEQPKFAQYLTYAIGLNKELKKLFHYYLNNNTNSNLMIVPLEQYQSGTEQLISNLQIIDFYNSIISSEKSIWIIVSKNSSNENVLDIYLYQIMNNFLFTYYIRITNMINSNKIITKISVYNESWIVAIENGGWYLYTDNSDGSFTSTLLFNNSILNVLVNDSYIYSIILK